MAYKLSAEEAAENAGYASVEDCLEAVIMDDENAPALCSEGCEVEPDGVCPHGFQSIVLERGLI